VRRTLAAILFAFEPFLAATLLLRVGPTLLDRDLVTAVAVGARILLALASVAAAIGLQNARPYATRLSLIVLAASATFAVVQYFTRVLPTSLAPDVAGLFTAIIVLHHIAWMAWLVSSGKRR
jgi:uncharacterized membrane-anchored protein